MAYVPDQILKCVVFLAFKNQEGEYKFAGSGFWVSRPGPGDLKDYRPAYLVTAAHVIKSIRKNSPDKKVWIRVNLKESGEPWTDTPTLCWQDHPCDDVDISVCKIGINPLWDHICWPLESSVRNDKLDDENTGNRKIELGDELVCAGLFYPHKGEHRNIPIVRIGNVSAMRIEPVKNRDGIPMDLYLAESRSMSGLSGSPVFIDIMTAKRSLAPTWGYMAGAYNEESPSRFKLFGIIHGHFGDDPNPDATADDGKEKININVGIAMVIPGEKIGDVVAKFAKEEEFEVEQKREKRRSIAVMDSLPQPNVTLQWDVNGVKSPGS